MREDSVLCMGAHGLHRMAYTEWGDPSNPRVVVCVHGLTRNGRDFDFLAQDLAAEYRVVCPDVVGRGRSEWLAVATDYGLPQYAADMVTLIARLHVEQVHWVGTSMGGLIGMLLASQPKSPIARLVLNDVGPVITAASIRRIGEYLGKAPKFASLEQAEAFVRFVAATFGRLTDAQWRHLTEHSVRPAAGGGYEMRYDPAIAEPFRKAMGDEDVSLWPVYDAIRCPTLVMRGAESDLLLHETALEMGRRGPQAEVVEIPGVGHAPMMLDEPQIGIVRTFLLAGGEV
jgi:pimeloyl-ACP methyl ester carboxylesterase